MEPLLSNLPVSTGNGPRDLLSRLYREIGISAVAAALEVSDASIDTRPVTIESRALLAARLASKQAA